MPGWETKRLRVDRSVLRLPWREVEYCVVDLETTGLDVGRDQILSYGAVLVRGGRVLVRTSTYGLVRPTRPIPPDSVEIHGLRERDLNDAPPLDECADALIAMTRQRVLVAHAAWIEQSFLGRAFLSRGVRLRTPVVDTAALARACNLADSAARREPSLEGLAVTLGLPPHTPHHALGDAFTTAAVLLALAARLDGERQPVTAGHLVRLTRHNRRRPSRQQAHRPRLSP